jgi:hypothetical protein
VPASSLTIASEDFTIVVKNRAAIADILSIAIGETPPSLAAVSAQTQELLKQAQSIKTDGPQPAVHETAQE